MVFEEGECVCASEFSWHFAINDIDMLCKGNGFNILISILFCETIFRTEIGLQTTSAHILRHLNGDWSPSGLTSRHHHAIMASSNCWESYILRAHIFRRLFSVVLRPVCQAMSTGITWGIDSAEAHGMNLNDKQKKHYGSIAKGWSVLSGCACSRWHGNDRDDDRCLAPAVLCQGVLISDDRITQCIFTPHNRTLPVMLV